MKRLLPLASAFVCFGLILPVEAGAVVETPTVSAIFPPMAFLLVPFILFEFVLFSRRFKRRKKLAGICILTNLVALAGLDVIGWVQLAVRNQLNDYLDYSIGLSPLSPEAPRLVDILYSVTVGAVMLPPPGPEYAAITSLVICLYMIPVFALSGLLGAILLNHSLPTAGRTRIRSAVTAAKLPEYCLLAVVSVVYCQHIHTASF